MLNWIVWNRTVYLYKMDLALDSLQRLICHKLTSPDTRVISLPIRWSFRWSNDTTDSLCYLINEWSFFFYINHFSLIIFKHSVWLGFEQIDLRVQVHSHWIVLCSRTKDMTITIVIINPRQNGAGVWMTSCPEEMVPRIWGFWKRVSWELTLDHGGRELSFCHWVGSWDWTMVSSSWGFGRWVEELSFSDLYLQRWIEILCNIMAGGFRFIYLALGFS